MGRWMIYGAYGYTGDLVARLAVERGESPVLAGRRDAPLAALGRELGLEHRAFSLDEADAVADGLADVDAVVHCAGPFSATSRPMVAACLATRTHYLDITGEIGTFEAVHRRDDEAKAAGVVLMPGVGFDVVPTDCLALMLREALPTATHLELAFWSGGAPSGGTAKTVVEGLPHGGAARIDGRISPVPNAWKVRDVAFHRGQRSCATIPWGDVSTAYYSTGIPNILVYMSLPPKRVRALRLLDPVRKVLGWGWVQSTLKGQIDRRVEGPDLAARSRGWSEVWGEARDGAGGVVTGTLTTPGGYSLTADSSVRAVLRVLAGDVEPGAKTPSAAFGSGYVAELDGVTVHGLAVSSL
jgi:short subunit dehydrogenase-like uncharacterized protein